MAFDTLKKKLNPDYLTSDDPQAQIASDGYSQLFKKALDDGSASNFQNPNQQERPLEVPLIDPIDILGGAIGSKVGSTFARDSGSILGNEVGALGDWKKQGYKIKSAAKWKFNEEVGDDALHISAVDKKGKKVGETVISRDNETGALRPFYTEVDPKHQRKGIASAMYEEAEKKIKEKLAPGNPQTEEAQALWNNKNRPFGGTKVLPVDSTTKIMSREEALDSGIKIPDAHTPSSEIDHEVDFNHRLNTTPSISYAVKDGKVIGHLGVDDNGAVKSIAIDPEHQRQGVAQSLYENYFKNNGSLSSDELDAMEPEAKKLWEKLKTKYPENITKTKDGYNFSGDIKTLPESLPMDEASRMARAKEMGFDTDKTYYHGARANDIEEFAHNEDLPIFLSEDPKFTETYSKLPVDDLDKLSPNRRSNTIPVRTNVKNTFDDLNPEHMDKLEKALAKDLGKERASLIRAEIESSHIPNTPEDPQASNNWSMLESKPIFKAIKELGFDSMNLRENGAKNIAVFHPKNIRSKFATFDPKKKDSSNLSASLAALGLGGAASQYDDEDRQTFQSLVDRLKGSK
jgi:ribosomal protein S18 acetylase RimI-like enzyme